jgi:hypothetical protein
MPSSPKTTTTERSKLRAAASKGKARAQSPPTRDGAGDRRRPRPESKSAAVKSKSSSKKKSAKASSTARPPPPPPPPPALIKLLQTNTDVLSYFQSLNANLTADVQIWKDRTAALKKENDKLLTKSNKKAKPSSSNGGKKRKTATAVTAPTSDSDEDPDNTLEKELEPTNPSAETQLQSVLEQGEPVADSMFAFESSSEDDDNDDGDGDGTDMDEGNNNDGKQQEQRERDTEVHLEKHTTPTTGNKASTRTKPMADHLFPFGSSSDEDDDDDDKMEEPHFEHGESRVGSPRRMPKAARFDVDDAPDIFPLLKEAFLAFENLGIALVDREEPLPEDHNKSGETSGDGVVGGSTKDNDNESNNNEAAPDLSLRDNDDDDDVTPAQRQRDRVVVGAFTARSDEHVLADLLDSIQEVTRMQLDDKGDCVADSNYAPPFVGTTLIPSCNVGANESSEQEQEEQNPAADGKLLIFRLLVILDNFCSPKISEDEWKSYFAVYDDNDNKGDGGDDDDLNLDIARCGLRGRKGLVNLFVSQMDNKLCKSWAVEDRLSRLTNSDLHYLGESNISKATNGDNTPNEQEGTKGFMNRAKSQVHLSFMVERCWLAQMLAGLYIARDDSEAVVRLTVNYTLSAIPSLHLEDYPKLPPVLCLAVLEGLLRPDPKMMWWQAPAPKEFSFHSTLRGLLGTADEKCMKSLLRSIAGCVHTTAAISKARLQSSDDRIQDISRVEVACYERLLESEASWIGTRDNARGESDKRMADSLVDLSSQSLSQNEGGELFGLQRLEPRALALEMALILKGDAESNKDVMKRTLECCQERSALDATFPFLLLACCGAIRQLEIRQLGVYQQNVGSLSEESQSVPLNDASKSILGFLLDKTIGGSRLDHFRLACTAILCAVQLADGRIALSAMQQLVEQENRIQESLLPNHVSTTTTLFDTIRAVSQTTVVRVITLERRGDRMKAFMSQALQQDLMVVKAVVGLGPDGSTTSNSEDTTADGFYFGFFAIDGRGRLAEVQEHLERQVGSLSVLNNLVATHWRPHDLKPFDKDAPDKDDLVRTSPTERACALSHVASWKGVIRSLQLSNDSIWKSGTDDMVSSNQTKLFHHPDHLLRLFRVSGFAEGPALLAKNANMPPAPVCVILEDDAILTDDFSMRLKALLKELPRDFHYCALGYGRPKTAPIVPYSEVLGIPTCLWYLTGYIMSLSGADYLWQKLPVVGPVDSWIGLMLTGNWDNVFGTAMGVGVHASTVSSGHFVAKRDLSRILQFRAFCALQPLCSQKVGGRKGKVQEGVGRSWRQQRDTDIVYSGDGSGMA